MPLPPDASLIKVELGWLRVRLSLEAGRELTEFEIWDWLRAQGIHPTDENLWTGGDRSRLKPTEWSEVSQRTPRPAPIAPRVVRGDEL